MPALVLGLTGCGVEYFFPSEPNDQPLSLTVRDGQVWFHWCGKLQSANAIGIDYARYAPSRTDATAAAGIGAFTLRAGDVFSSVSPPAGVQLDVSQPVPVTRNRTMLFVSWGPSAHDMTTLTQFDTPSLAGLRQGSWLYPDGSVHQAPCEMKYAVGAGN